MDLQDDLASIPGLQLTSRQFTALRKGGLTTVEDVLLRLPKRHDNRLSLPRFEAVLPSGPVLIGGLVTSAQTRRIGPKSFVSVEIQLQNPRPESPWSTANCRWFGMPFMNRAFKVGDIAYFFGSAKVIKERLTIDHPEHEVVRQGSEAQQVSDFVPIYNSPKGIQTRDYREVVRAVLVSISDSALPDLLPRPSADGGYAGCSRALSLRHIHFPETDDQINSARRYLALEWLVGLNLGILDRRRTYREARRSRGEIINPGLVDRFLADLPFDPTPGQTSAIAEVTADLQQPHPMNRLLHGDVGAGKTVVAAASAALAIERGTQVALMAPTQILAEQHFATLQSWFCPLNIRLRLLTADRQEDSYQPQQSGGTEPQFIIGTHALLHSDDPELQPGMVIIDEQHKFGVGQRESLIERSNDDIPPDVLVLTATPIPRTLVLTSYGDLDVSTLTDKPAGRSPIRTAARFKPDLRKLTRFLKDELEADRQVYILFPVIDGGSKGSKLPAIEDNIATWKKRLSPHRVEMVHGGIPTADRDELMTSFRTGETKVLLCTTVIEVGVDVPNATVMLVFGANAFGLAQLHQLRGRVGRGEHRSYCILVPKSDNPDIRDKMAVLEGTGDGFEIAEADLRRRGPGEILGVAQSGYENSAFAELLLDADFCDLARKLAARILRGDPTLKDERNKSLYELGSPRSEKSGGLQ